MVDNKGHAGQTEPQPGQERSPPEYDAPVLAPEVTREVLEVFAEPVYGKRTHCDGQRVTFTIESRDTERSPGEIRVSLKEQEGEEAELTVDGTPAVGSGISMSISAPASEWALAQTVIDHNLLTELVFQGEPVLSIYGPPAKLEPSGIAICGDSGDELLIPEEHRR
jgi:hypothetical protein